MSEIPQPVVTQKVAAILDQLVMQNILERQQMDIYVSRYQKAYEVLQQSINNEQIHNSNISDLHAAIIQTESEQQQEIRKQQQLAQQIFKLRSELQEAEQSIFNQQSGNQKYSNEHTMLAEDKMLKKQEIEFIKRERADVLQPQIAELEIVKKKLNEQLYNQGITNQNLQAQINQAKEAYEVVNMSNQVVLDEIRQLNINISKMQSIPEKLKKQAALTKQSLQSVLADVNKREAEYQNLNNTAERLMAQIEKNDADAANCRSSIEKLSTQDMIQLTQVYEASLKDKQNLDQIFRNLRQEQDSLNLRMETTRNNKTLAEQQRDQLVRDVRTAEKKAVQEQDKIDQKNAVIKPTEFKIVERREELQKEEEREKLLDQTYQELKTTMSNNVVDYAANLNQEDEFTIQLQSQIAYNKSAQDQIYGFVREIRDIQIEIISRQSQRQAISQKLTKISQNLKQTINTLQIRDTEADRLNVELNNIEANVQNFHRLYEEVKTEKNRLSRLSQEAKLAIQEVREKIEVLSSETNVLTSESATKSSQLQRRQIEVKDAQRQTQTNRQELANAKQQLREAHSMAVRQISELEALGSVIAKHEQSIYDMKEMYIDAVEKRNQTSAQIVSRNDELCALYERLHTQEAVEKEAEAYMKAREEDVKTLNLMIKELLRDKDILQRANHDNLPGLKAEIQATIDQLADFRAENEQLLLDIRTTAAITSNNGQIEAVLDLQTLYKDNQLLQENEEQQGEEMMKSGKIKPISGRPGSNQSGRVQQVGQTPPQQLRQIGRGQRVCATWNMVGSLERVAPHILEAKQKDIEKRSQTIREWLLEKYVMDEELQKLIDGLQQEIDQQKKLATPEVMRRLNDCRADLRKTTRQVMAAVSGVSLEQATCLKLKQLQEELQMAVEEQNNSLLAGAAPSDEIEHEWMVMHQNELDYARARRMLDDQLAAQVPGVYPTTAKPRFDSYINAETSLPRPYGGSVPLMAPEVSQQMLRTVKKPKPYVIDI